MEAFLEAYAPHFLKWRILSSSQRSDTDEEENVSPVAGNPSSFEVGPDVAPVSPAGGVNDVHYDYDSSSDSSDSELGLIGPGFDVNGANGGMEARSQAMEKMDHYIRSFEVTKAPMI